MKRFYAIALVALLAGAPAVQAQGMKLFEGTWSQVLAEAQRTGRPIYLDAYASWCGPCKLLKRDIFPREDVGAYFNANYISYSLDMEKGEGIELAKKYGVQAYPTHLYFDSKGELVHRAVGGGSGDEMAASFIKWAQDARDPSQQLYTLKRRFDKGERDVAEMYRLMMGAADASMPEAEYYALEYFRTVPESELYAEKNFKALTMLTDDFDHPGWGILMRNRAEFVKHFGEAKVDAIGLRVAAGKMRQAEGMKNYGEKLFTTASASFKKATDPNDIKALGRIIIAWHESKEDWTAYATDAVRYVEAGRIDNANELNELAWAFYEHVDDKAMLAKAATWAETALSKETSYAIADTYASVLFKLGRREDARKAAVQAIELGRKEGADFAETEALLARMSN